MTPVWQRTGFAGLLVRIWFVNFLAFCLMAQILGGDAVNGRAEAGLYFRRITAPSHS